MKLNRFHKCHFVLALFVAGITGCDQTVDEVSGSGSPSGSKLGEISGDARLREIAVQLNWYPESEHGGVFQAAADSTYQSAGFHVDIRPGGRATPVAPELELERVQFAVTNADDVVLYRQQGMDIVAVMAVMQNSPRCILVQKSSGIDSFKGLAGMTLQRQAGRLFVEFMRSKGVLEQVQEVPYHGSVASLIGDPKIAIQAYSFAEPLLARQQGVEVTPLMVSELGWNPYSSVLVTSGKMIRERPRDVQDFVTATRKGWQNYLLDGTLGNQAILAANEHGMTQEALTFGADGLAKLAMPAGMNSEALGMMSAERWASLVEQVEMIAPSDSQSVASEDCYTLQFLK